MKKNENNFLYKIKINYKNFIFMILLKVIYKFLN